jgi:hypothetical protein
MRTLLRCFLAFALLLGPLRLQAARFSITLTVVSGTPIHLAPDNQPLIVSRIIIQMKHGGTGMGQIMLGVPKGTTPATSSWPVIELAPATATAPGQSFSDEGPNINLAEIWCDGSHSGDLITVSYDTNQ